MWKQAARDHPEGPDTKEDKQHIDSQADSGFLSGSNLISSSLSISSENEERKDETETKIAPEPAKASESGLDLGFTDSLSQLTLKVDTANVFDSGNIDVVSEELASSELGNEIQELWETYYIQDEEGDTQLHLSIIQKLTDASFFIINSAPHPCLLNILNDDAQTPLHLAVLTSQPKIIRKLILSGADPTVRNFKGNTPLHLACDNGDLSSAKALTIPVTSVERSCFKSGKTIPLLPQNLEQRNFNGEMCIHLAASQGHIEVVRHLLLLGADPNAREALGGRTALHLAIEKRRIDIAQVLVQEGRAQVDACTYAGFTAYHLVNGIDEQLAKELVKLGATPSIPPDIIDFDESDEDEDDEDEEDEGTEEDSEAFRLALLRIGFASQATVTA